VKGETEMRNTRRKYGNGVLDNENNINKNECNIKIVIPIGIVDLDISENHTI